MLKYWIKKYNIILMQLNLILIFMKIIKMKLKEKVIRVILKKMNILEDYLILLLN